MTALATMTRPTIGRNADATTAELDYPSLLATYRDYDQAQRLVDHLSDEGFPVQNVTIIGTGLRSVERVTGRLTRARFAAAGALSGLWAGLFVGIAFALFASSGPVGFLLTTPILGAAFGLIWSQLGFRAATRYGARDFTSFSRVIASDYDVMVEHGHAAHARQLLAEQWMTEPWMTQPIPGGAAR